jgi:integrase
MSETPKRRHGKKPIPLTDELVTVLQLWRAQSAYTADTDWVFAGPRKHGAEPYWPDSALKKSVQPAVEQSKLGKKVGWHTFRHSYSTLLRANGTDVKVQQDCCGTRTSRQP